MSFEYTNAYIGPYCVSYAQGEAGQTQRFRLPLPVVSREHIQQGLMITEGDIRVVWAHRPDEAAVLGPGGSFVLDRPAIPLAIDAEVTLTAVRDCAFLCVTAVGIEQKVELERHTLSPSERVTAERYSLVSIAGENPVVRINGGEPAQGVRLLYARNSEMEIEAVTSAVVGKFFFAG
ncbi:MAG: hypothetical protein HYU78_14080 [Rhodocyclales bacterium]|nr:hypothetical protein [Rhodocyclales bacterium]